jgi:biofilm PGA synthesis lipoprotein PgaB
MATSIHKILLAVVCTLLLTVAAPCFGEDRFITLVYHDITTTPTEKDDISEKELINQIEYLRSHGYTFISQADVIKAAKGAASLPSKAVLLTFDDAYVSFYRFVYPILRLYDIPAVLSVVTSWIDNPESSAYKGKSFMSWRQLRELSDSGLITIASHSSTLHTLIQANPSGNMEPAPSTFRYLSDQNRYETEDEFRQRIRSDLAKSIDTLKDVLGKRPIVLAWPYGSYNSIGIEEAKSLGFEMILTLDEGYSETARLERVQRHYLTAQRDWVGSFKDSLARGLRDNTRIRGVQIDLDLIVNSSSYSESDRNLGQLIERLVKLGVNTVFLQGFCDKEGTGNVKSLYFANSVLPVEMDFLSHAVNRMQAQGIKVFVWMPALAYELPDPDLNQSLKVREWHDGSSQVTSSWYRRFSPFAPRTQEFTRKIFRDLAATVNFNGILIQDDAYLTDAEDFHPAAIEAFRARYGTAPDPAAFKADRSLADKWIRMKIETLDTQIAGLASTVRNFRPGALIARNIYSKPVTDPESREWFAQDFKSYLEQYDLTVIMAYASMEGESNSREWYRWLFRAAGGVDTTSKVLFKLQAHDWKNKRWLSDTDLKDEMAFLLALGVRHIAYYPDNLFQNRPDPETISTVISARNQARLKPSPPAKDAGNFLERFFRWLFPGNS